MKLSRLFAIAALLFWAAAIWPTDLRQGELWILLDRSPSMGEEPPLEEWLADAELDLQQWRRAVAKRRVVSFPHPKGLEGRDLAVALAEMRPRLSAGDRLVIRSDGRVLSVLPDPSSWGGIEIRHVSPRPQPRFRSIAAPASWPLDQDCWLRLHFADADLEQGRLEVTDTSGQVRSLELRRLEDQRLALRLAAPSTPTEAIDLRLRWEEPSGVDVTGVRIAAPGGSAPLVLPPDHHPEDLRAALRTGQVVTLASSSYLPWLGLPPDLELFRPLEEESAQPLWILLDSSGSMEGPALEEAKTALAAVVGRWPRGPVQVVPFQQELLANILLEKETDLARLDAVQAFGPTELAAALRAMGSRLQGQGVLWILSDGAAGRPETDWPELLAAHLSDTEVFCLPVGPDAEWDFLRGLGTVLDRGELADRLVEALDRMEANVNAPAFPLPRASLPLPEEWQTAGPRPAWQAAPGVEVLLEDAAGQAVLVARRVGLGLLLGLADDMDRPLGPLLHPIAAAYQAPGRDGWMGDRFLVRTQGEEPLVRQDGHPLEMRMLEPGPPVVWQALGAVRELELEVTPPEGTPWTVGALVEKEYVGDPEAFARWLEIQRNGLTEPMFRPRLLWTGLILLTVAFVLRTLPKR